MSTKGVYSALSGSMAQSERLDTIANNIANVNTPSFKKDQQVFKEYLTVREKEPSFNNASTMPTSIESFYDMKGIDKSFVDSAGTFTDFSQGGLKPTGNPLDVAMDGKGFFEVMTTNGVRLTRNGSFRLDGNGQLVTKDGFPVLKEAEAGADPASRVIKLGDAASNLTISDSGEVSEGGSVVAKLSVVDVANKDTLSKLGNSMYNFKPNSKPEVSKIEFPSLKQGFIETSNVNIVREMTDMIATTRNFESTQKVINTYDSMNEKLINVVGKTRE